jgi:hypothetical protein
MSHISTIGAVMFSDLSMAIGTSLVPTTFDAAGFAALFTAIDTTPVATAVAGGFVRITNVRDFPAMGTPPNIVKVPVYGQKQSKTIQGQADAPQLEIELNFIPADWDRTAGLGFFVGDGVARAYRFTLLQADPGSSATYASSSAGYGSKEHTVFYWVGKMEALLVKPSVSDAAMATLTLSIQSDFYGAYTHA